MKIDLRACATVAAVTMVFPINQASADQTPQEPAERTFRCINPSESYGLPNYPGELKVSVSANESAELTFQDLELLQYFEDEIQDPVFAADCRYGIRPLTCRITFPLFGGFDGTHIVINGGRYEPGFSIDLTSGTLSAMWSGTLTNKSWFFKGCREL